MRHERRRRRRTPDAPTPAPSTYATRGAIAAGGNVIDSIAIHAEHALSPEAYAPIPHDAPGRGVSNIPRSDLFVGREDELAALDAAFSEAGEVVVHAVHGLGGVGKSALAAHWATRRPEPVRWWITADTPTAVNAGLAALARALHPGLAQLPAESQTERALRWLTDNHEWLLVLDNVENPSHIHPLVDRTPGGRVLITTRRATGWHHHARTIRLEVLEPSDATALFTRILTHHGPRGTDGTKPLCAELGHLALAVEQAAAYCAETGTTPTAYLDMLAQWPATMFAATAEGSDATRTIARIWRVTLDRLAETPLAGEILRVLAWYAPDHIPRDLLAPLAEPPELTTAIGRLIAHGMITDNHDGTLTIHRLVQSLARTQDPEDPHRRPEAIDRARDQATVLLAEALPFDAEDPANRPRYRALLPHTDALTDHHTPDHDTTHTALVLTGAAVHRRAQGASAEAILAFRRALTVRERTLGDDHLDTHTSRNNLATAYESAGDAGRAVPLFERALADHERHLGDDPGTLTVRNNLACAYHAVGDLDRAVPLYERTLADRERLLGHDHRDTLTSRNNLARAYQAAGDLRRAIPLHERTLEALERVLGEDHPSTLVSRYNLATAYEFAGDLDRAVPLHERTLADRERVLGHDHPHTLASRNNVATVLRKTGHPDRAIALHQRTLADIERVLGHDHPDTLMSRNDLACAYQTAGDPDRAIALHQRTLADRERVLGPAHPHTLTSRDNLARAYQEAGNPHRAIGLHRRALADSERVLGPDHPDTLAARNNLAYTYQSAGNATRAIPLHERNLRDAERVLTPNHSGIFSARYNLATAYMSVGDPHRAIPLLELTLRHAEQVPGEGHLGIFTFRRTLAAAYISAGDPRRAISLFERTLDDHERTLGDDHPDTLSTRCDLVHIYRAAGDPHRALALVERMLRDCERVPGPEHPLITAVRVGPARARVRSGA